jgi:hypothetical protein
MKRRASTPWHYVLLAIVCVAVLVLVVIALAKTDKFAIKYYRYRALRNARRNPTFFNTTARLVIARYAEDLAFLKTAPFNLFKKITIYNKGRADDIDYEALPQGTRVVHLPNVGRCDHAALFHFHDAYENLDDVTLFMTASADAANSTYKMVQVLLMIYKLSSTETPTSYFTLNVSPLTVRHFFENFKHDGTFRCKDPRNLALNPDTSLQQASPRPMGKWMDVHLQGRNSTKFSKNFIFAASRRDILSNSRDFYARLKELLEVGPNPEAGHFFEHAWAAVLNVK